MTMKSCLNMKKLIKNSLRRGEPRYSALATSSVGKSHHQGNLRARHANEILSQFTKGLESLRKDFQQAMRSAVVPVVLSQKDSESYLMEVCHAVGNDNVSPRSVCSFVTFAAGTKCQYDGEPESVSQQDTCSIREECEEEILRHKMQVEINRARAAHKSVLDGARTGECDVGFSCQGDKTVWSMGSQGA